IDGDEGGLFFVEGPRGTRKTLLGNLCEQEDMFVATGISIVAAFVMLGGRPTHSQFKILLSIDDGGFYSFTKQSGIAKLLSANFSHYLG
ncbi:hypothetical protein Q8G40_28830, partial [Klebsiella pneumoniae]|uniref:hypothetical protein n=1 Tax=Klebsiella pneumoniae TaxID=573 RepID=UPI0030132FC7